MPTALCFLRGVNVGGRNRIKMADLRQLFISLGFRNPRTALQSGNIIFETDDADLDSIRERVESGIKERYGFDVQAVLRGPLAFQATLDSHPFTQAQLERGSHAMVAFLSDAADTDAVAALRENNPGNEVIATANDALYIFYTDGVARSKLDTKRIERALGVHATARNWNTCMRIKKLLDETVN